MFPNNISKTRSYQTLSTKIGYYQKLSINARYYQTTLIARIFLR